MKPEIQPAEMLTWEWHKDRSLWLYTNGRPFAVLPYRTGLKLAAAIMKGPEIEAKTPVAAAAEAIERDKGR
jgi:hypothetical protein